MKAVVLGLCGDGTCFRKKMFQPVQYLCVRLFCKHSRHSREVEGHLDDVFPFGGSHLLVTECQFHELTPPKFEISAAAFRLSQLWKRYFWKKLGKKQWGSLTVDDQPLKPSSLVAQFGLQRKGFS
jgi:hypothetical protein